MIKYLLNKREKETIGAFGETLLALFHSILVLCLINNDDRMTEVALIVSPRTYQKSDFNEKYKVCIICT